MFIDLSGCHFKGEALKEVLKEVRVKELVNKEEMPFIKLPCQEELAVIEETVEKLKRVSSRLVVVGMGGSSRGAKAVDEAVGNRSGKLLFIDNIDPELIEKVFRELKWEESSFAFISKSGKTLETITAMNLVFDELRKRNLKVGERSVFIGNEGNPLQEVASSVGANFLSVPKEVGGRFSVFTAVGALPLNFAGYNLEEFYKGALKAVKEPEGFLELAAAKFLNYQVGRKISVIMPYSSFMNEFTEWYAQLWAESLGKEGKGQTPVKAIGTSSQHAILQLFIEGPDDKFYQLLKVREYRSKRRLPKECLVLPFLGGKEVQEVIEAEFKGTVFALKKVNRPLALIELEWLSERELGELMMGYMIAVVVMGKLLGVNPYGQPGVEIGKKVAIQELRRERDGEGLLGEGS
ncbi:glucose-6-phosphate isomerase [Thermovibrio sp.]